VRADTSALDAAVIALLSGDAALMALMPGGVWWDLANASTDFVIVSEMDHSLDYTIGPGTALENVLYLVKAVTRDTSGTAVRDAAQRIFELLQDATITVTGYHPSASVRRVRRIRYTELDEETNQRWQHRGGHYEVRITPQQ
jgi:hypothetical protein